MDGKVGFIGLGTMGMPVTANLAKAGVSPVLQETKRTYDEGVERGWGKEDFSAVTHVIEHRIGRGLSLR